MPRDSKLVFTSDPEQARKLRESQRLEPGRDTPPGQQTIRLEIDRKSRGGKRVTVASGFALTQSSLNDLAKTLKSRCGSGGTVRDNAIEIQGDHLDAIGRELLVLGYKVRRIG